MYKNDCPLPEIITGKDYIITHIEDNVKYLFKFGFTCGAATRKVFKSPSGNPSAYEIMGTVIALRDEDAANISVKPL